MNKFGAELISSRWRDVSWDRKFAIDNNKKVYVGKICKRHPSLNGLRNTSNSKCVKCQSELGNKHKLHSEKRLIDLDKGIEKDPLLRSQLAEVWD